MARARHWNWRTEFALRRCFVFAAPWRADGAPRFPMAEPITRSKAQEARVAARPGHIVPIEEGDLPDVGAFLARHFGAKRSLEQWQQAITPTWCPESDHGYLLRADDGRIGGVIVLF